MVTALFVMPTGVPFPFYLRCVSVAVTTAAHYDMETWTLSSLQCYPQYAVHSDIKPDFNTCSCELVHGPS